MELCRWSSVAFFAAGGVFLLLRFFGGEERFSFILLLCGAAVTACIAALIRAFFSLPAEETLTVYLSSLVPGGGLVLSAAECAGRHGELPPLPLLPKIRYLKRRRHLTALFAALCFAGALPLVPVDREKPVQPNRALDLKDETEKFSAALESLRRSGPEGAMKALPLQKEFEETVKKADPAAPGRSYELLHQLNRRLRNELAAERERSALLQSRTAALRSAAESLSRSGGAKTHGRSFSELLKAMAKKDPRLAESLKRGGFNGSPLSSEQLKKLADSLGRDAERLKKNLQEMNKYLENASTDTAADLLAAREELENFIKENVPGCDDLIESLTNRENNGEPGLSGGGGEAPGTGGSGTPGRGRGDAVLEFSGFTPEYGARRVDKKIQSHLPGSRKGSSVLGRFAADSEQKEEKYTVKGGTLQDRSVSAGFQESDLYPAHRRAVRRYFEKEKRKP